VLRRAGCGGKSHSLGKDPDREKPTLRTVSRSGKEKDRFGDVGKGLKSLSLKETNISERSRQLAWGQ